MSEVNKIGVIVKEEIIKTVLSSGVDESLLNYDEINRESQKKPLDQMRIIDNQSIFLSLDTEESDSELAKDLYLFVCVDEHVNDVKVVEKRIDRYVEEKEGETFDLVNVIFVTDDYKSGIKIEGKQKEIKKSLSRLLAGRKLSSNVLMRIRYFSKINNSDKFVINTKGRFFHEIAENSKKVIGHLFIVKLTDLLRLYEKMGDTLFKGNLRYGLGDILDVNQSIASTLKNNPDDFWFLNNGITIKIKQGNIDYRDPEKLVISNLVDSELTVINGAQTITTSSKEYYSMIDAEKESPEYEEKKRLENESFVILKIVEIPAEMSGSDTFSDDLTVALNRQKPIEVEDIAYTSSIIKYFNQQDSRSIYSFSFVRRGEDSFLSEHKYALEDYARIAILLFENKPGSSRSSGRKTLLAVNKTDEIVFRRNIFPGLEVIDTESFEGLLETHYKAVNYSMELFDKVNRLMSGTFIGESDFNDKEARVASYGKYMIIYVIINCIVGSYDENYDGGELANVDYSRWIVSNDFVINDSNINQGVLVNLVKTIAKNWSVPEVAEEEWFDSNYFKRDSLISKHVKENFADLKEVFN